MGFRQLDSICYHIFGNYFYENVTITYTLKRHGKFSFSFIKAISERPSSHRAKMSDYVPIKMMDDAENYSNISDDDSNEKKIVKIVKIVSSEDKHAEPRVLRKRRNINERFVGGLLRRVSF